MAKKKKEKRLTRTEIGVDAVPKLQKQLPGTTIMFVEKTIESGPNKGMRHVMRLYRDPMGRRHSSPVGGSPRKAKRLAKRV